MKSPQSGQVAQNAVLATSRNFEEYLTIFSLEEATLRRGIILDCAAGASDFGLRVRALGGQAVSTDPLYRLTPAELIEFFRAEKERSARYAQANPQDHRFRSSDSFESTLNAWRKAALAFFEDYTRSYQNGESAHYVAARLPNLPFADKVFSVALVSHFLFCYPDALDEIIHDRSIVELCRVSREVRIHPICDHTGRTYAHLDELRLSWQRSGVETQIVAIDNKLREGYDKTLICYG